MPEKKEYNKELQARLEEYRSRGERPMTMSALARELGVSSTRVNKYLAGNPEGNVVDLEARIEDMLKAAARRKLSDVPPFATNVTRTLESVFEMVRKTSDVGLVSGPAGIGKTVTIQVYLATNPTAIAVSIPRWQRTDAGLVGLIFEACETSTWDGQTPRARFLAERLRGSNRLLVLDNAQRMTASAREWLFDFHDTTGCPVVMLGNPEILQAIRGNDQQFSRIGIHVEVKLDQKQIREYARSMVSALVPDPQDGLLDLAVEVVEQRGHLRALKKQLLLMLDLASHPSIAGDQVKAFHNAHTKLVRDYQL